MTQPDKEGNYCFAMLHKMQGSSQKACCPEAVRCDCSVSSEGMKWADSECDARLLPFIAPHAWLVVKARITYTEALNVKCAGIDLICYHCVSSQKGPLNWSEIGGRDRQWINNVTD